MQAMSFTSDATPNAGMLAADTPETAPAPVSPTLATVKDASDLVAKTVFIKFRFGCVGNSRKVSGSDVLSTDADKALLKVSKQLLDSPELEAIKQADTRMRTWLYNTCLPFDMGIMILPVGLIETAETRMKEYRAEREELIAGFISAYSALKEKAASHLGSLYDPSDYPSPEAIRARFVFDWQYVSFSVPGHLKGISAALFQSQTEKHAQQLQAATEEITALMRQTLFELVSHLQDRLTPGDDGKQKILRESAVKNLQDFLNSFDLRNVTDDKELAAQVAKVRELVSGTSAATLRSSDQFREKIRSGMQSITAQLAGMVEEKAGRKFRTDEDEAEPPAKSPASVDGKGAVVIDAA